MQKGSFIFSVLILYLVNTQMNYLICFLWLYTYFLFVLNQYPVKLQHEAFINAPCFFNFNVCDIATYGRISNYCKPSKFKQLQKAFNHCSNTKQIKNYPIIHPSRTPNKSLASIPMTHPRGVFSTGAMSALATTSFGHFSTVGRKCGC